MTIPETNEVRDVVKRIEQWPTPMRFALAHRILESLERPVALQTPSKLPRGPSVDEIVAMFKTDKPAPDDATVKQLIDE